MNYEILFQGDLQEDERLQRDFRVLLATRAGSQPVDRDLGIDWSCLDGPPEAAEVMFRMEVEIKKKSIFRSWRSTGSISSGSREE